MHAKISRLHKKTEPHHPHPAQNTARPARPGRWDRRETAADAWPRHRVCEERVAGASLGLVTLWAPPLPLHLSNAASSFHRAARCGPPAMVLPEAHDSTEAHRAKMNPMPSPFQECCSSPPPVPLSPPSFSVSRLTIAHGACILGHVIITHPTVTLIQNTASQASHTASARQASKRGNPSSQKISQEPASSLFGQRHRGAACVPFPSRHPAPYGAGRVLFPSQRFPHVDKPERYIAQRISTSSGAYRTYPLPMSSAHVFHRDLKIHQPALPVMPLRRLRIPRSFVCLVAADKVTSSSPHVTSSSPMWDFAVANAFCAFWGLPLLSRKARMPCQCQVSLVTRQRTPSRSKDRERRAPSHGCSSTRREKEVPACRVVRACPLQS